MTTTRRKPTTRTRRTTKTKKRPAQAARARSTTTNRPRPALRFTPAQVRAIRAANKRGQTILSLSDEYEASLGTVSAVVNRRGAYANI